MPIENGTILRDLGDELIMRRSTAADADALAAFYGMIFNYRESGQPNEYVGAWARDLAGGGHPTFRTDDFILIENRATGQIISSLNLISQTWDYAGIPFGVGRVEVVGTRRDYRGRGLVRMLFDALHALSAERGELIQSITGIPYFYRQFGYEMTINLGGERVMNRAAVPLLKEGQSEPYRVRPATPADLPFMATVYGEACRRYLVTCPRDEAMWRYELGGRSWNSAISRAYCIVESADGQPAGYVMHTPIVIGPALNVNQIEMAPGVSWTAVMPSVLRYLKATGEAYVAQGRVSPGHKEDFGIIVFGFGTEHPVYQAIDNRLSRTNLPYAWYIRVPDLPAFLKRIGPVLEKRLAGSIMAGHTGELLICLYRTGARLAFEQGRLTAIEKWQPDPDHEGDAAFPALTFLQLLFGYRTLEEIKYAFPDCWTKDDNARALLNILFPKQISDIWPVA